MRRSIGLSALLVLAAVPALAHGGHAGGHEVSGFLHPFSGLDHLVAMVGVGLWAALLGSRRPAAMVAVPAAFLAMITVTLLTPPPREEVLALVDRLRGP